VSELGEVIGALQAAISELGGAGIDRTCISVLEQEEITVSCAGAVGRDIKQMPPVKTRIKRCARRLV
jgi:hypothetical protein